MNYLPRLASNCNLLISTSPVATITGVSHQCLAQAGYVLWISVWESMSRTPQFCTFGIIADPSCLLLVLESFVHQCPQEQCEEGGRLLRL
jgi:hypothetical protein